MSKLKISIKKARARLVDYILAGEELKSKTVGTDAQYTRFLDDVENWVIHTEGELKRIFTDSSVAEEFSPEFDVFAPSADQSLEEKMEETRAEIDQYLGRLKHLEKNIDRFQNNSLILAAIKESKLAQVIIGLTFIAGIVLTFLDKAEAVLEKISGLWDKTAPIPEPPTVQVDTLFVDDFSNDVKGWGEVVDSNYYNKVEDGVFKFQPVSGQTTNWVRTLHISDLSNGKYTLHVKFQKVSGSDHHAYSLLFNYKDWDNNYELRLTGEGTYELTLTKDGEYSSLKKERHPAVNTGNSSNALKMTIDNGRMNLLINEQLVLQDYPLPIVESWDQIGFVAWNNVQLNVDDFWVIKTTDPSK